MHYIQSQKANSPNANIDLSGKSTGVYYVEITTDKGTQRKPVIKN